MLLSLPNSKGSLSSHICRVIFQVAKILLPADRGTGVRDSITAKVVIWKWAKPTPALQIPETPAHHNVELPVLRESPHEVAALAPHEVILL